MRHHLVTSLVVAVCVVLQLTSPVRGQHHRHQRVQSQQQFDELWTSFVKTYGKVYVDDAEESYRRSVWQQNVDDIQRHNLEADLGRHSFTLGINEYSDLTADEYKRFLSGFRPPGVAAESSRDHSAASYDDDGLDDAVDWRPKGYVTPVKNQGGCGSCWAFSSTGALEGQHFKKTGKLVSLSEQNLVDCSRSLGNEGCGGGWMNISFIYVNKNLGIDTEASYPYEGDDARCRYAKSAVGATCTGFVNPTPGDEQALKQAVATVGPISVAIDANHPEFFQYRTGVLDIANCTQEVDHAVLVVGYGSTPSGQDYWIVKNSWGTSWGTDGYVWMSRNKKNQCSIASFAIYPTV